MKNVNCHKLLIDRAKAPKNVPTFSHISTFASFRFPSEGDYKGGFIAQSLAGRGKISSKKKNNRNPIARNTGATNAAENFPHEEPVQGVEQPSDTYAVQFIQHVQETSTEPLLQVCDEIYSEFDRPEAGFGLKKSSGVRTTFTQKQKEVMIEFYNRQHATNIRSTPQQVNAALRQLGEKELTEQQIKGFWGSHSQKRKRMLERIEHQMNEELNTP